MADIPDHIRHIWNQAELIKKLSDRVVGLGPFGIGMDGLLAFIPGANLIYGVGAGGLLIAHAFRAEAEAGTIAKMVAYLAFDNLSDLIPIPFAGSVIDALFPGHLLAAKALQHDIEMRYGPMREPKRRGGMKKVGEKSIVGKPAAGRR